MHLLAARRQLLFLSLSSTIQLGYLLLQLLRIIQLAVNRFELS